MPERRDVANATWILPPSGLHLRAPARALVAYDFALFEIIRLVQQHGPDQIRSHDVNGIVSQHARPIEMFAINSTARL